MHFSFLPNFIKGVTPEPDSNEDSSDFMYEGITIEPPSPNVNPHPSDLFTISVTPSFTIPQAENPSSSSSITSFSSKETTRLANNGCEEKNLSLGEESPQDTYGDVLDKVYSCGEYGSGLLPQSKIFISLLKIFSNDMLSKNSLFVTSNPLS